RTAAGLQRRPGPAPQQRPDAQRQAAGQVVAAGAVGAGEGRRRGSGPPAVPAGAVPRADRGRAGPVHRRDEGVSGPGCVPARAVRGPVLGRADGPRVPVQPLTPVPTTRAPPMNPLRLGWVAALVLLATPPLGAQTAPSFVRQVKPFLAKY